MSKQVIVSLNDCLSLLFMRKPVRNSVGHRVELIYRNKIHKFFQTLILPGIGASLRDNNGASQ